MSPEDEKRLAEIRAGLEEYCIGDSAARWLLAKFDESERHRQEVMSCNAAERRQKFEAVGAYSKRLAEEQAKTRDLTRRLDESERALKLAENSLALEVRQHEATAKHAKEAEERIDGLEQALTELNNFDAPAELVVARTALAESERRVAELEARARDGA